MTALAHVGEGTHALEGATSSMTLNLLVKRFPETLRVLHDLGLDTPWGGCTTLEAAARYRGVPMEELLGALSEAIARHRSSVRRVGAYREEIEGWTGRERLPMISGGSRA